MKHRVAILASQRSGTHALGSLLEQNSLSRFDEVFMIHEEASPLMRSSNLAEFLLRRGYSAYDFAFRPRKVLNAYFDHLDTITHGSFFIDIKYNTLRRFVDQFQSLLSPPLILMEAAKRGYIFIHLVRRNGFLRYLSERVAEKTGQYHITNDRTIIRVAKIEVNIEECLASIRLNESSSSVVREWISGSPHVELNYEEVFVSGEVSQYTVRQLEKVGIVITCPRTILRKLDHKVTDVVTNYGEVKVALEAAGFGHLLETEE